MSRRKINVKALTSLITALINGSITLAILLIAPLGLAAVITNTILVMIASLFSGSLAEILIGFLSSPEIDVEILPERGRSKPGNTIDQRRGAEDLRRHDE